MGVGFVLIFVVIFSVSSPRSSRSFLRFILTDPLSASHSHRPSLCITKHGVALLNTESEWIRLLLMDSPTFLSTSRSACFGDLSSTRFYQCSSWRLHWCQSTSHHTAFPSADIHVWFPSQWHPFRCYILHLDTWGLDTLLASIVHFLTADFWCVLDFLLALRR